MKGAQKPKRDGKKPAQKTLKEKRQEKRNAAKGTGGPTDGSLAATRDALSQWIGPGPSS